MKILLRHARVVAHKWARPTPSATQGTPPRSPDLCARALPTDRATDACVQDEASTAGGPDGQSARRQDRQRLVGATGLDILQKVEGMRKPDGGQPELHGEGRGQSAARRSDKYQELCRQAGYVCKGVSLKDANLTFKWADAFDAGRPPHGARLELRARVRGVQPRRRRSRSSRRTKTARRRPASRPRATSTSRPPARSRRCRRWCRRRHGARAPTSRRTR